MFCFLLYISPTGHWLRVHRLLNRLHQNGLAAFLTEPLAQFVLDHMNGIEGMKNPKEA